ncbi:MAG: hypothetical protein ABI700_28625, partial [Chloroflexota bacterium]
MNTATNRFSFLDILDRTFRIYRENFIQMIGYVALISIPITIIDLVLSGSTAASTAAFQTTRNAAAFDSGSVILSSLLVVILSLVEIVLTYSVVCYVASESYFGRKTTVGEAFRASRARLTSLGCSFVLFYMVLFVFAFAIVFVTAICNVAIIGLVVVVYIGLATFAVLTPVLVLENLGASAGITRAYGLGRARFWTAMGVLAAVYIIQLILNIALTAVLRLLGLSTVGGAQLISTVITAVISAVVSAVILPLFPISMTLIYYDTRTRVEGLDLAMAALDKPDPRPSDVAPPPRAPFMTSRDLINMVILGVGGVALSIVAGGLLVGILNSIAPGLTLPRR